MSLFTSAILRFVTTASLLVLPACTLIPPAPGPESLPPTAAPRGNLIGDAVMLPLAAEAGFGVTRATAAVRIRLNELGFRVVADAPFQVEIALAKRASSVGYQASDSNPTAIARPHDGRIDLCREHVFRLTIVVFERQTSAAVYRGAAEKVRCGDLDEGDLRGMAQVALGSFP